MRKGTVIVNFNKALQHAAQPASLWRSDIFEGGGFVCWAANTDSYDETFQNDTEEPEGRDRKGNRPGVLRCSYCVKQGNVVSTQLVVADQRRENSGVEVTDVFFFNVTFRGKVGRGGFSLWMTMQSVITSLTW